MLSPLLSSAQQDSVQKATEVYCVLITSEKALSKDVDIKIDYGYFKDKRIKDQSADVFTLSSIADALNVMSKQGWQFVSAYTTTLSGSNVCHYVLRRELASHK